MTYCGGLVTTGSQEVPGEVRDPNGDQPNKW